MALTAERDSVATAHKQRLIECDVGSWPRRGQHHLTRTRTDAAGTVQLPSPRPKSIGHSSWLVITAARLGDLLPKLLPLVLDRRPDDV